MIANAFVLQTLIAAVLSIKAAAGENQKCYVCIPNIGSSIADVIQIFPSGPSLPLCNKFQMDKKEYIRECPSSKFVGCLTQTNGTHITKTCSSIGVEDCKTANRIEYCYCKGQLCNGGSVPKEEARPPVTPGSGSGDDDEDTESYMEGSGSAEDASISAASRERKSDSSSAAAAAGGGDEIGIEAPMSTTVRAFIATVDPKKSAASAASAVSLTLATASLTFLYVCRRGVESLPLL